MKKILVSGLVMAILFGGAIILTVVAQTTSTTTPAVTSAIKGFPAMVLEVNQNGKILLRGTVDSLGSNSLTVKSWGGNWTINISTSTKLQPNDVTKFQPGDFVGVQGIVNQGVSWTIDATLVRDFNLEQRVKQAAEQAKKDVEQTKKAAEQLMKSLMPKNWQGIVSNINVSGNSFTLTVDSVAYTINLAAGAQLINKNWGPMTLANVNNGDTVRVWGPVSSTTITASILRDISIPVQTTPPVSKPNENQGGNNH